MCRLIISRSLFRGATQVAIAGLLATAFPRVPAASAANEYQVCAAELRSANVAPEQASAACASALHPKELSGCVQGIKQLSSITSRDTVSACFQARRPLDLATCAIEISIRIPNSIAQEVLNNCSRSLLPTSFSNCVVGLHREIDVSASKAMESCISGRDYPENSSPTYVPSQQLPNQSQPAPFAPIAPGPNFKF